MYKGKIFSFIAVLLLLGLSSCHDDEPGNNRFDPEVGYDYYVAVFYNSEDSLAKKNMAEWAAADFADAQKSMSKQLSVGIRWYNCDNKDWILDVENAVLDNQCTAIIGPEGSTKCQTLISVAKKTTKLGKIADKPIILPTATSVDLQRQCMQYGNTWFMSENDLCQGETMLRVCQLMESKSIMVISSDDAYGLSFHDKMPFMANEWGIDIGFNELVSPNATNAEIEDMLSRAYQYAKDKGFDTLDDVIVLVASSNYRHYKAANQWDMNHRDDLCIIFTDNAGTFNNQEAYSDASGIALAPNIESTFIKRFKSKFPNVNQGNALCGEAFIYDAVMMALLSTYAHWTNGTDANEAIKRMTTDEHAVANYDTNGIQPVLQMIGEGNIPQIYGMAGEWDFYKGINLHPCYYLWEQEDGKINIYFHIDSETFTLREDDDETLTEWTPTKLAPELFESIADPKNYGELGNKWAVIVASSIGFENYRHNADALAIYQTLKRNGYDDNHILLIINDAVANDTHNPFRGVIKSTSDGVNLMDGAVVDYHTPDLTPGQLQDLLTSGDVFAPQPDDNVFIFWSGHGTKKGELCWRGNNSENISTEQFCGWLQAMSTLQRYRKLMLCIEACYSGAIAKSQLPTGVLCMTAANSNETSIVHGDSPDAVMGTYLCDEFSYIMNEKIKDNPSILVSDLYKYMYLNTATSHVTLSDIRQFGAITKCKMDEFIK